AVCAAMRVAVALPTGGLLVGCVLGVLWPDAPSALLVTLLIGSAALSVWAAWLDRHSLFVASIVGAFGVGGWLLTVGQWQDAWRSTLKIAFESMARDERHEWQQTGRFVPEED